MVACFAIVMEEEIHQTNEEAAPAQMPPVWLVLHIHVKHFRPRCRCLHVPGAPLTIFNDGRGGGPTEVHILYQKIITTSEFVYPKKSLLFIAYPKKSLNPFFATPKNPSVFLCDPKKTWRLS